MKRVVPTSYSTKSPSAAMGEQSEMRDSCYFPGCRKDTNCNCEICLASINATLDLMPCSAQHSSLTRVSSTPQRRTTTPLHFEFDPLTIPSTPPLLQSTAKSRPNLEVNKEEEKDKEKKGRKCWFSSWGGFVALLLCVSLIYLVDSGFSAAVSGAFRPAFSTGRVRKIGEESWVMEDLEGRLKFVEIKIGQVVDGKVSNCSAVDSIWHLYQDELLLVHSRCILYKSRTEAVSIWGWPLQTSGMLTTGFNSISYTILSGRVTEWSEGKMRFSVHKSNSSWMHQKWSASALQLDPNTWVLEYRQNALLQNSTPCKAALELLKYRFWKVIQGMKHEFWPLVAFPFDYYGYHYNSNYNKEDGIRYHAT